MKRIILFIALTILVLKSNAQQYKEYFNNGKIKVLGAKENNLETGEWKYFFENGTLNKIEKKENDKEQIERILSYYFKGTKTDNPELLKKAFHSEATLKFINNKGAYTKRSIQTFFSYFKNTKTRSFKSKIYYIDITGSTANVKLSTKYKTYQYIDYMNMLKTKDGWKIVSKISHQDFF